MGLSMVRTKDQGVAIGYRRFLQAILSGQCDPEVGLEIRRSRFELDSAPERRLSSSWIACVEVSQPQIVVGVGHFRLALQKTLEQVDGLIQSSQLGQGDTQVVLC